MRHQGIVLGGAWQIRRSFGDSTTMFVKPRHERRGTIMNDEVHPKRHVSRCIVLGLFLPWLGCVAFAKVPSNGELIAATVEFKPFRPPVSRSDRKCCA